VAADDVLRELREAAKRRAAVERETERARAKATAELVAAIRRAQASKVPTAQIARELGMSRQRVYKLLERR
jgi:DNA-binding phage protein